jgi:hypothetical protein
MLWKIKFDKELITHTKAFIKTRTSGRREIIRVNYIYFMTKYNNSNLSIQKVVLFIRYIQKLLEKDYFGVGCTKNSCINQSQGSFF